MTMNLFVLLILAVFASEKKENVAENGPKNGKRIENNEENSILVKIEEDDYVKVSKKSKYIGVRYLKNTSKWQVERWSKDENKTVYNGYFDDEETAAYASDTLARNLMENGEQNFKLNFPDDNIEVYPEEKSSKFIGVSYNKNRSKWRAQRRHKNTMVYNGYYDDEETAAHASDTLARKLRENDKKKLKLNFPDDNTEVYKEEKSSKFIGVSQMKNRSKWRVQRRSKNEKKLVFNGYFDDEETAAHASDTLARKLMADDERDHKLNFPDEYTEVYPKKSSEYIGVCYNKIKSKWQVRRWSKDENKLFYNGYYSDEETAAHASDTLARKITTDGGLKHKLNFPEDYTEFYSEENQNTKRKRPKDFSLEHFHNN